MFVRGLDSWGPAFVRRRLLKVALIFLLGGDRRNLRPGFMMCERGYITVINHSNKRVHETGL